MAYDATKPENAGYLSGAPDELRTNFEGLKGDQIVDAGTVKGLTPGNANGNIPVSNGVENVNLNAGMVNGKTAADFAPKAHAHDAATSSSDGFETAAEHNKLAGIAEGAEVNQNAFSSVKVGDTTIQADSKTDTLEIASGANIAFIPDVVNDRVTIAVTGKVGSAAQADSAGYASSAGSAPANGGYAAGCTAEYISGGSQIPSYYGSNKLRLSMLMTTWGWADCLWMSGYGGDDVKLSNQLVFSKYGVRAGFRLQNYDSNTWGTLYEFIHSGNIGNQSVNYATTAGSAPANGGNADTARGATANIFSVKGTTANPPSYRFDMSDVVANDFYMSSDGTVRLVDYTHAVYRPFRAAEIYSNDKQVATVDQVTSIVASGSGTNYYWRKWSNGDIEQFVYIPAANVGGGNANTYNITFPLKFPNKVIAVLASIANVGNQSGQMTSNAYNWSLSGFVFEMYNPQGNVNTAGGVCHAIGN
ncbi:hypothetical protein Ga0466249_003409 [Sporomusaceae bacterium BoRhaA]|uniref:gp53-like domain-containing protein n=1 Tax=Pelorhabdus rhamnosifermentans TaxID=2772457 RepID=UPI001C064112|nr:hypothetical protein [Pelorhabdus rhamnosifermentans]MBU2702282.1 hypothetical protein [Pelorhabdus rhamnosifermentans]